jgi:hypothetical protein
MRSVNLRRAAVVAVAAATGVLTAAGPVLACAGLVTPSGNVQLVRTSTLAAWHAGYEHYVTAFTFTGGGAEVGSLVPLPGVPSKVERGGDWTLQRLDREATRQSDQRRAFATAAPAPGSSEDKAEVVQETRIDALDITILKGGGQAVADWAQQNGFSLSPDAPEVLEFYASRSPVFMAARFDATAARQDGQQEGEGTPVHLTIPLEQPWVPLRILGLGRPVEETINADVFLLTPERPALMPAPTGKLFEPEAAPGSPGSGLFLGDDEPASPALLDDLRSDKGMEWVPSQMWFTSIEVIEQAGELKHDLAVEVAAGRTPSAVAAGLEPAPATTTSTAAPTPTTQAAAPAPAPKPAPVKPAPPKPAPAPTPETTAPPAPEPAPVDLPTLPDITAGDPATGDQETERRVLGDREQLALPARPITNGGRSIGAFTVFAAIAGGGLGAGLVAAVMRRRGLS